MARSSSTRAEQFNSLNSPTANMLSQLSFIHSFSSSDISQLWQQRHHPKKTEFYVAKLKFLRTRAMHDEAQGNGRGAVLAPFTAARETNPLVIERSEGSYVFDKTGKKYLDALAGLWCTSLGGQEPRLINAAVNQMKTLPFYHSFSNHITGPTMELSKELIDLFTPAKMSKVFFTNDGSEANDTQVKLVWYYNNALGRPQKKKIIARQTGYHGSTVAAASLTGLTDLHKSFDLPIPSVLHTDCPHYWRYHNPGESEEDFATRLANNLEQLIIKEGPDTIAAFIAEPVIGAGGVIPPPDTYFEKVQAVLRKHDVLFIADEVICGFGRVGTMFGCEKYNIKPDLVTIAKALSSGYLPIGAVLLSPHIAEVVGLQSNRIGSFWHGFTYTGHPVPTAVAIETLKIYKERKIVDHVKSVAPLFQEGVREAIAGSPVVGEVRGIGLVLGIEFTRNKSPTDLFPESWAIGNYFASQCAEQGLLMRFAGDTVMMSPPLIITREEINKLISILKESVRRTEIRISELEFQSLNLRRQTSDVIANK